MFLHIYAFSSKNSIVRTKTNDDTNSILRKSNQNKPLTTRKLDDNSVKRFKPSYGYGKWEPIKRQPVLLTREYPSIKDETYSYFPSPLNHFQRAHENLNHTFLRTFLPPRNRYQRKKIQISHQSIFRNLWKINQEFSLF